MKFETGTTLTNGKEGRKIVAISGVVYYYLVCGKTRDTWQLNPDAFYCQKTQLSKMVVIGKCDVYEYEVTAIETARSYKDRFYKKVTIINETLLKDIHN